MEIPAAKWPARRPNGFFKKPRRKIEIAYTCNQSMSNIKEHFTSAWQQVNKKWIKNYILTIKSVVFLIFCKVYSFDCLSQLNLYRVSMVQIKRKIDLTYMLFKHSS